MVEAAIVLPLWLALFLCALQLALLAQARLLAEYAAFQAARAGIVWNADPGRMRDAAAFVLAPTACPSRAPEALALCRLPAGGGASPWGRQAAALAALHALSADEELGFPGVHVHILSPHWPTHGPLFDVGPGEELDFDLFEPLPELRRDATLLTIRLQYWLELKIPFADWILWSAWIAGRSGVELLGSTSDPLVGPQARAPSILERGATERGLLAALAPGPPMGEEIHRGSAYPLLSGRAWGAMLASGFAGDHRSRRRYFIPIVTHHTMRMQSNVFARFVRGCACSTGAGCGGDCRAW